MKEWAVIQPDVYAMWLARAEEASAFVSSGASRR